ncbi:MAG: BT_3987 domain-containing protein [Bacteroidales bacterium]
MNKKRLLTYLLAPLLLASCDRDFVERVPELISAGESGIKIVQAYDLGEKYTIPLSVARGGLNFQNSQFQFVIDEAYLDSINKVNQTNYKILPDNCYEIKLNKTEITNESNAYIEVGEIIYDPAEIAKISDFNLIEYTIPLRLKTVNVPTNQERDVCIYAFEIAQAKVTYTGKSESATLGNSDYVIQQTAETNFPNRWNLEAILKIEDEDFVNNYNEKNGTNLSSIPSGYLDIKNIEIVSGSTAGSGSITIKKDILPGNYLLPVSVTSLEGTEGASIVLDAAEISEITVVKLGNLINKGEWTITANTEELTGEGVNNGHAKHAIDGNNDTFWHSKWNGGTDAPPFILTIDMKKTNTISQLGLIARQNAVTRMNMEFKVSEDGANWTPVGQYYMDGSIKTEQVVPLKTENARYIQCTVNSLSGANVGHLAEIKAYGIEN